MKRLTQSVSLVLFLLSLAFQSAAAVESEETDLVIEEIIVTAQKREQNLQDVPISVAVVSGAELAARNSNEISELSQIVPGFSFGEGGSDAGRNVLIRGVGTQTFSRGVEQSVGTVVDGVVVNNVGASVLDLSDVSRVEVLRGPQGMLFGKNASAGLLNIVTNGPTEEFALGIGGSYADGGEVKTNGYISGPMFGDKLLGRLSFYTNKRDALIKNIYSGGLDYNDRDEWGMRGKLEYRATDDLNFLFTVSHTERDHICCTFAPVSIIPGSPADVWGATSGAKNDTINENDDSGGTTDIDVFIAEINYSFGDSVLTSLTSYSETDLFGDLRADNLTITAIPINTGLSTIEQVTQEFRLTSPAGERFEYVAGLYFYDNEEHRDFVRAIDLFALGAVPVPGVALITLTNVFTTQSTSYAAFGQGTWNLNDRARISVGARVNREEVSTDHTVGFLPGTIPEAPPGTVSESVTDNAVSWRLIGEYDVTENAMIYASAARGYKGPGANTLPSGPSSPKTIVDPEIPTNFELGLKSDWFNRRLRANATLFHTTFEDFQTSITTGGVPIVFFLDNAGELQTQGLELELNGQVSERLSLSAAMAYVDAEFTDYEGAACYPGQTEEQGCVGGSQDLSGGTMPNSPEWSFSISGRYDIPLPDLESNMFLHGAYYWQDEVQYSTNNNPRTIGDAYGVADFSLGIETYDGRFSAQLFVKNAFDKFYQSGIVDFSLLGIPRGQYLSYNYTRRVGVAFQFNF